MFVINRITWRIALYFSVSDPQCRVGVCIKGFMAYSCAALFPAYCSPLRTAVCTAIISIKYKRQTTARKNIGTAIAASTVILPFREVKTDTLSDDVRSIGLKGSL